MDEAGEPWADGPAGHGGAGRQGFPVDPHRLKRALLGGKRWLIGAGIIGAIVGFLYVKLMMVSDYETTVVLNYEGDLRIGDHQLFGYSIAPAADALHHQSVLREIREELGLESNLTAIADSIDYETDFRAGTVRFTVSGETGEDASEYARVVTNVFMAYHKDSKSRRIETEIARTEKRIEAAQSQVESARRRYEEFREKHGIADLSTEQQSMLESAANLRAGGELAELEIRLLEARIGSFQTQLSNIPKMRYTSGGSSPERATYERLRQDLVSAKATLSADHPQVQALEQQVAQLRTQLRSGSVTSSPGEGLLEANATYQFVEGELLDAKSRLAVHRERQKFLATMADKARRGVEAFSDIGAEATALLADVKVNEDLVGGLRNAKSALEDALRVPRSGFVVLDPGGVPEYPVKNKKKLVVFLAIPMLSVMLVMLVVLRREFGGLRLETPAEVAFWGQGPVLAATPWPGDPGGLDDLVAGLDDYVPHAKGSFLVVGSSSDESRLAHVLVGRINRDWFPTKKRAASPGMAYPAAAERAPLQTPPPSGPYPVGRSCTPSVALVRLPSAPATEALRALGPVDQVELEAWNGPLEGQSLRRAARLADRVVILVRSGAISVLSLNGIQRRFGRERGIGYIVVGLPEELHTLPDRVGDVAAFWRG